MYPYIHRDISWLDFNYRVLQEAKDPNVPLLERIKFLAIYSSNLDEFFRVRVANHRSMVRLGQKASKELNYEPSEILDRILKIVSAQQEEFSQIFNKIIKELSKHGVNLIRRKKLTKEQTVFIENYFREEMLPYAQPVVLDGKKIKPFLNNGALYLALDMYDPATEEVVYAIVKVPSDHLPRFIKLPTSKDKVQDLILLGDVVRHNIRLIFPGYDIRDSFSIKLTRDAELYIDDEYSGDLIEKIKKSLINRSIGPASRLVYDRTMPKEMLNYFMNVFDLTSYDLLPEGRYHNNSDFFKFPDFGFNHLKDPILPPLPNPDIESSDNIFDVIREGDQLIHVPYQSYESVIKFFEDAAEDLDVTHIKIIQYRVAKVSRIMNALKKAVANGKQVSAFIEVKARFDEEANLIWGEDLEGAGVNVFYSFPGLKVHSKVAIVRRIEEGKPKLYGYLSTGNFHEGTAKVYSDIGLFTANHDITSEVTRIFSYLETKTLPTKPFVHLGVGQFNLKDKFIYMVQREIDNAKEGKPAMMTLKMNSLQDEEMIDLLYEASKVGVQVRLIIRGVCSILPGLKNVSDNITAISIVDRFLEHARIYWFHNGGKDEVYFSSADWMERNLHHRIETLIPLYDDNIRSIVMTLINIQLTDNIKARKISVNNTNEYARTASDLSVRSQIETYYFLKRRIEQRNLAKLKEKA